MWLTLLAAYAVSLAVTANAMCTQNTCMNGYCTSGNRCMCYHGYTKDPNGRCIAFDRCMPGKCHNGICSTVTFLCTCRDGFFKDPNGNCARTEPCTIDSCKNGICSQGGHCYCRTGYFKSPNGECIAVALCTPASCPNGVCDQRTQECICNRGYTKSINGQCIGFGSCQLTCQNGQCAKLMSLQEVCYCNPGFQRDASRPNTCASLNTGGRCQATCKNGQCARLLNMKEVCYCNPGFQRDAKQPNTCVQAGGGGEAEMEHENEMGQQATTTMSPVIGQAYLIQGRPFNPRGGNPVVPQSYRAMNPGLGQLMTTPVPYTQVRMPQPTQQGFDNSIGNQMHSGHSVDAYEAAERKLMALYLRLLSLRHLIEALT